MPDALEIFHKYVDRRSFAPSCLVDGCESARYCRGYCTAHYQRFRKYGDPLKCQSPLLEGPEHRFWLKVDKTPGQGLKGDCWEWQAGRDNWNYGQFYHKRNAHAHRFAWWFHTGEWPQLDVLDRCDNPPCCNPAHLFLGTPAANMADKTAKGRATRGEQVNTAKLTENQVREMRALVGVTYAEMGRIYGINEVSARRAYLGLSWRSVT